MTVKELLIRLDAIDMAINLADSHDLTPFYVGDVPFTVVDLLKDYSKTLQRLEIKIGGTV